MGTVIFQARVPGIPPTATAQQKGVRVVNGRPHFFQKKRQRVEEANAFAALARFRGDAPAAVGPCACYVYMVFPYRKGERKAVVRSGREVPMCTGVDVDNATKGAVLDVLTKLQVWGDDKQCSLLTEAKVRGPVPYWTVRVEALDEREELPLRALLVGGGGGDEKAAPPTEAGGAARAPIGHSSTHNPPDGQMCFGWAGGAE